MLRRERAAEQLRLVLEAISETNAALVSVLSAAEAESLLPAQSEGEAAGRTMVRAASSLQETVCVVVGE